MSEAKQILAAFYQAEIVIKQDQGNSDLNSDDLNEFSDNIVNLLSAIQKELKLEAMKCLRNIYKCSLGDAKVMVDRIFESKELAHLFNE